MPINNLDFNAQVNKWVRQTEARMTAVFRESTQRVVSEAQSRIPVDTGFARASIRASLSELPQIDPGFHGGHGQSYSYDQGSIVATIASAKLGETIYVGWTANYVIYLEYGHSQQAPSGFVRISAMQWPRIVSEVSAELRSRAGG